MMTDFINPIITKGGIVMAKQTSGGLIAGKNYKVRGFKAGIGCIWVSAIYDDEPRLYNISFFKEI